MILLESFSSRYRPSQCFWNFWDLLPEKPLETVVKFQKIWRLWLSEDGDGKAHLNRTKSSFPFAALRAMRAPWLGETPRATRAPWVGESLRATCAPWLGETPRATRAPWLGESPRATCTPWLGETEGKHPSLPSLFLLIPHAGKLNAPSESVQARCTCGFVWPCTYLSWGPSSRCCVEIALHWGNCSSSRWSSVNLMRIITQTLKHRDDVKTASQDQNG